MKINLIQRIKNLWELSNFKITESDTTLNVIKKDNSLSLSRPLKAQIISKIDPIEEIFR